MWTWLKKILKSKKEINLPVRFNWKILPFHVDTGFRAYRTLIVYVNFQRDYKLVRKRVEKDGWLFYGIQANRMIFVRRIKKVDR